MSNTIGKILMAISAIGSFLVVPLIVIIDMIYCGNSIECANAHFMPSLIFVLGSGLVMLILMFIGCLLRDDI